MSELLENQHQISTSKHSCLSSEARTVQWQQEQWENAHAERTRGRGAKRTTGINFLVSHWFRSLLLAYLSLTTFATFVPLLSELAVPLEQWKKAHAERTRNRGEKRTTGMNFLASHCSRSILLAYLSLTTFATFCHFCQNWQCHWSSGRKRTLRERVTGGRSGQREWISWPRIALRASY